MVGTTSNGRRLKEAKPSGRRAINRGANVSLCGRADRDRRSQERQPMRTAAPAIRPLHMLRLALGSGAMETELLISRSRARGGSDAVW